MSDVQAYLNKGYGFHGRPVRKRPADPAKELAKAQAQLAKAQAQLAKAQARVEALKRSSAPSPV
jgi:hypothetical protein